MGIRRPSWYEYQQRQEAYRAITGRGKRSNDRNGDYYAEEHECGRDCECDDN